jgi:predicted O-linked N-acetylglucosamine transferase (SPINDLY family)
MDYQRSPQNQQTLNKSLSLFQAGRPDKAEKLARAVLAVEPRNADLLQFVATLCQSQEKFADAVALCAKAVAIAPHAAGAHYNLGTALMKQGQTEKAIASFEKALALAPASYDVLNNLALALTTADRASEAEAMAKRAIAMDAREPLAHNTLGLVLYKQMRLLEAVECFKAALARGYPEPGSVLDKLGLALFGVGRLKAGIESLREALVHKPKALDIMVRLGNAQILAAQHLDAARTFDAAMRLAPRDPAPVAGLIFSRLHASAWTEHGRLVAKAEKLLGNPSQELEPFSVLSFSDDPAVHLRCSKSHAANFASRARKLQGERVPDIEDRSRRRIRIAYLSSDFKVHATMLLAAGLFEHHDRKRFETYAIAWAPDQSSMRRRAEAAFHEFIDVTTVPDAAVGELIREHGIDIAIDLNGYASKPRPAILVDRPAPIQVAYLGYPGTMGAQWIDYVIADRFVAPPEVSQYYSEKLVYLPGSYQINDDKRDAAGPAPERSQVGLPAHGFVFTSFNANNKITPDMFAIWMRLLKQTPGSVLWLLDHGELVRTNLRREAEAAGVDGQRLVFAPRLSMGEHASRLQCADLFLDTLPYNAHTTASDALWAGVPIVTCPGRSFQARVAGSLLHAVGLPEMIATSLADYEGIALRLAHDRDAYAAIRAKAAANRLTTPLFATERFTRNLEAAFEAMWLRWCQGLPPAPIDVSTNALPV